MSKGKGGVYFILYLAVLLELLIIIVERDEAEEHLKKEQESLRQKNKRIQLIAETIINALRGSQTSLSSTSNQSMTLGDPKEPEREFLVKVRVSDPSRDSVNDLSLAIYRNDSRVDSLLITGDTALYPRVKVGQDYIFNYKFKPSYGEGIYKLRFSARTNQVIGVAPGASENDTVKIGAVQLTVKELKEVKNGIAENVQLRGYIDSLLSDQYRDFSTNIGNNEFVVDVKRPEAKVFDQLAALPGLSDFNSFPGIELPNPIRIEGAQSKGVVITKTEGPGEIRQPEGDTNWYWFYKPNSGEAGQGYTVRYQAKANRGGGAKDIANGQFTVTVKPLTPVAGDSAMYFPTEVDEETNKYTVTPYTRVPFKVNGKYAELNGSYRIKLTLDGADFKTVDEPTVEFTPVFLEHEGKKLGVKILFRSPYMREYVQLQEQEFVINPPIFQAPRSKTITEGNNLVKFSAGYGIEGFYTEA
ncbi:MAG TPA: hypothetical protein VIX80_06990, partial [Candidatus Kapabacteria bacterium]